MSNTDAAVKQRLFNPYDESQSKTQATRDQNINPIPQINTEEQKGKSQNPNIEIEEEIDYQRKSQNSNKNPYQQRQINDLHEKDNNQNQLLFEEDSGKKFPPGYVPEPIVYEGERNSIFDKNKKMVPAEEKPKTQCAWRLCCCCYYLFCCCLCEQGSIRIKQDKFKLRFGKWLKFGSSSQKSEDVLSLLIRLYAHDKTAITNLEEIRVNPDYTSNFRSDLEFFIPQLCSFYVKGDHEFSQDLVNLIVMASTSSFFFSHRVWFFFNSMIFGTDEDSKEAFKQSNLALRGLKNSCIQSKERLYLANSTSIVKLIKQYQLIANYPYLLSIQSQQRQLRAQNQNAYQKRDESGIDQIFKITDDNKELDERSESASVIEKRDRSARVKDKIQVYAENYSKQRLITKEATQSSQHVSSPSNQQDSGAQRQGSNQMIFQVAAPDEQNKDEIPLFYDDLEDLVINAKDIVLQPFLTLEEEKAAQVNPHESTNSIISKYDDPNSQLKKEAFNAYLSTPKFIKVLTDISDRLKFILPANRDEFLTLELKKVNYRLPAAVYIPFVSESIRNYAVLHIVTGEAKVFQTKERAPLLLCIEAFRPEEIILLNPPRPLIPLPLTKENLKKNKKLTNDRTDSKNYRAASWSSSQVTKGGLDQMSLKNPLLLERKKKIPSLGAFLNRDIRKKKRRDSQATGRQTALLPNNNAEQSEMLESQNLVKAQNDGRQTEAPLYANTKSSKTQGGDGGVGGGSSQVLDRNNSKFGRKTSQKQTKELRDTKANALAAQYHNHEVDDDQLEESQIRMTRADMEKDEQNMRKVNKLLDKKVSNAVIINKAKRTDSTFERVKITSGNINDYLKQASNIFNKNQLRGLDRIPLSDDDEQEEEVKQIVRGSDGTDVLESSSQAIAQSRKQTSKDNKTKTSNLNTQGDQLLTSQEERLYSEQRQDTQPDTKQLKLVGFQTRENQERLTQGAPLIQDISGSSNGANDLNEFMMKPNTYESSDQKQNYLVKSDARYSNFELFNKKSYLKGDTEKDSQAVGSNSENYLGRSPEKNARYSQEYIKAQPLMLSQNDQQTKKNQGRAALIGSIEESKSEAESEDEQQLLQLQQFQLDTEGGEQQLEDPTDAERPVNRGSHSGDQALFENVQPLSSSFAVKSSKLNAPLQQEERQRQSSRQNDPLNTKEANAIEINNEIIELEQKRSMSMLNPDEQEQLDALLFEKKQKQLEFQLTSDYPDEVQGLTKTSKDGKFKGSASGGTEGIFNFKKKRGTEITKQFFQERPQNEIFKETSHEQDQRVRLESPFGNLRSWRLIKLIVKSNDDMRQEQFAMQLISQIDQIFKLKKCNLWLRPYEILATGPRCGLLEVVTDALSIDSIKRRLGNNAKLIDYFKSQFGDKKSKKYQKAKDNFCRSLAAYSLVCFILQIKDRHNGNIMVDIEGHIMHIDFGFLLSNAPGRGIRFEQAPFKLTSDMVEVLGGIKSSKFREFRELMRLGFMAIQEHADKIVKLVEMMYMSQSDLPCFKEGEQLIKELKQRILPLGHLLTEMECYKYVDSLIENSYDNWRTRAYDRFQYCCQGIL